MIRIRARYLLSILLFLAFMLPILTDAATAMVIVRSNRGDVPAIELVQLTLDVLQDRPAIQAFRQSDFERGLTEDSSSASYIDNVFLTRFSNLKYVDNSLVDASDIPPGSPAEKEFREFQSKRILTELPAPLLTIFGMTAAEKDRIGQPSWGDMLYSLSIGKMEGGKKTTHFLGTGTVGFGILLYFLIPLSLLLSFAFIDAHSEIGMYTPLNLVPPRLSIIGAAWLYNWFVLSNANSATELMLYPTRAFFEPILLLLLARWSKRLLFPT